MSITLKRHGVLQSVSVEAVSGLDGQGKPSYGTAVVIQARVVREDSTVAKGDGSEIKTVATLWIDAEQSPFPDQEYRITLADGLIGIVAERVDSRGIQSGDVDHVRIKVREE